MKYWLRTLMILAPLSGLATCSQPTSEAADLFVGVYSAHVTVAIRPSNFPPMTPPIVALDQDQPLTITRSSQDGVDLVINDGQCLIPANAVTPATDPPSFEIRGMRSCRRSESDARIELTFVRGQGTLAGNMLNLETTGRFIFLPHPDGGMPGGDAGMPMIAQDGMFNIAITGTKE